ncbi:MAG: argininosuccinate lyase [Verrucomicrobia bacterium]|nr:argininosuccinate lyase [Verrucomicrobiota bacterium]
MDKHWSGRFTKATSTEVEAFTASIFFDCALAEEDILGSLAHVQMLGNVGILTAAEAQEIRKGLFQVFERFFQRKVSMSAADEDIHMKVETELKLLIGPLAGKLHTARSRNDQIALDLHLYLRSKVVALVELLKEVNQVLLAKAKENGRVIMPGYTHLQRAQPILFAHHLLAYVAMFQRDIERLQDSWPRLNQLALGACALAGTGFPIDRQMVADLLKFDGLYENSIDAVSDRDFCVEFLANAALIMTHLSRLSEEIVLWCSQEFAFIELDDAYCSGSSIMPQKKNPDIPELVRGKTGRVYGSLLATLTMLKGLPLAYNKDMQEDKEALFDTMKTVEGSLSIYKGLINTLSVHQEKMLQATQEGLLNATELADYLASKGLPFREAHTVVGKIVRYCLDEHQKLEALTLDQFKSFSPLFSGDVFAVLDLEKIVNTRNSRGGTSSAQAENQYKIATINLEKTTAWISEKQKLLQEVKTNLILQ